jgi:quercetin 2,3-dioxygenase
VTRIFQIWIPPTEEGGKPSWGAKPFPKSDRSGRFVALASGFPQDNEALPIRAQARVLGANLKAGETVTLDLIKGGHTYLVPARGTIDVNGTRVNARDGAAIRGVDALTVMAIEDSEVVLVEAA